MFESQTNRSIERFILFMLTKKREINAHSFLFCHLKRLNEEQCKNSIDI